MAAKTVEIEEISQEQLDALVSRLEEAIEHELALSPSDLQLLLSAISTLATVQEQLESKDVTLHKLRKLLGMIKSSEKRSQQSRSTAGKSKSKKKERKPRAKRSPKKVVRHALEHLKKGDTCEACNKGKLYKFAPGNLLRITAQAPLEVTQHILERLRCNGCGQLYTAELPEEVLLDGKADQQYGYSAQALLALHKFFSGIPYYHQGNLNTMLGVSIAASTVFDQCEAAANAMVALWQEMKRQAADAGLFMLDDTHNMILDQVPEMRKERNGNGERLRTGVYSSGLIAKTIDEQEIVLFCTSLGHAGEFIDEILTMRTEGLPKPAVIGDALSANVPTVLTVDMGLCNSHGRRQFFDIKHLYPDEVEFVLDRYDEIWDFEHEAKEKNLSASERLAYHKKHSLPYMEELKAWCLEYQASEHYEEHGALASATKYFVKHYDGLTLFCIKEGIPIDNNRTEETLKMVIRSRKTSHFFKTTIGADVANILTSVIATAWRAKLNVFEYLTDLQRYQDQVKLDPKAWMPNRYLETMQNMKTLDKAA